MNLGSVAGKIGRTFCLGLVTLAFCSSLILGWSSSALASTKVADLAQNPVERGLNEVAGAGTADQIKGQAQEDLGKVQRQIDKAQSQVEGAGKQVQGRAQKDLGRTQEAAEDAADAAQDKAEGFVDSVKDLFVK